MKIVDRRYVKKKKYIVQVSPKQCLVEDNIILVTKPNIIQNMKKNNLRSYSQEVNLCVNRNRLLVYKKYNGNINIRFTVKYFFDSTFKVAYKVFATKKEMIRWKLSNDC